MRSPVRATAAHTVTSGFSPAWSTRKSLTSTGRRPSCGSTTIEVLDCSPVSTRLARRAGAVPPATSRRARAEGTSCSDQTCWSSVWAKTGSWAAS
ncbi:hypothetical protein [Ornithinimicrobium kibberense]|uniref:hypothetical protein n=1 Tax=Ornithinimicrobium kibberense TaxID=282060 RepID=UPI00361A4C72